LIVQEFAMIRQAVAADAEAIARIYNHYIFETIITFEEQPVSSSEMAERIVEVTTAAFPWLVVEQDGMVVGYAYAARWKARSAYRYSVETTVYVAPGSQGQGRGTDLYQVLLKQLKDLGLHVAIGGIALPNAASVALHEKLGFRKVARFTEVGFKFGTWIDVGYWQVTL
jgi:L-amino acid N-acyltransferase YncA